MKIGVIGPEATASVVRQVMESELLDVQLVVYTLDSYQASAAAAEALQRQHEVDALLFAGPLGYDYARKRVSPTIPWSYLPHSYAAILQALFEAAVSYHSDLKAISTDRYEPELIRSALDRAGVREGEILQAPYDEEEPDLERKLVEFHRNCYRSGKVSVCITSMEYISQPLLEEGIPCVRVSPTREVVQERLYHLWHLHTSAAENRGKLAVIAVTFDYVFDDERDLALREWEKVRYQNEFREQVYTIAQQMEAAVFPSGLDRFFIATTRDMLENVFLQRHEHAKLLQFGQRSSRYRVWLGMGVGNSMLEANSRASMALNRSVADRSGTSYLVEHELEGPDFLTAWNAADTTLSTRSFAEQTRLSVETLKKLAAALGTQGAEITSDQLAARLGITVRSVNRIITCLEEADCVATVGKRSTGKGRPARVMRLSLPEELYR